MQNVQVFVRLTDALFKWHRDEGQKDWGHEVVEVSVISLPAAVDPLPRLPVRCVTSHHFTPGCFHANWLESSSLPHSLPHPERQRRGILGRHHTSHAQSSFFALHLIFLTHTPHTHTHIHKQTHRHTDTHTQRVTKTFMCSNFHLKTDECTEKQKQPCMHINTHIHRHRNNDTYTPTQCEYVSCFFKRLVSWGHWPLEKLFVYQTALDGEQLQIWSITDEGIST